MRSLVMLQGRPSQGWLGSPPSSPPQADQGKAAAAGGAGGGLPHRPPLQGHGGPGGGDGKQTRDPALDQERLPS